MSMKDSILFIDPPASVVGTNSGLGYLAGSLNEKGVRVRVLDFNNNQNNQKERLYAELRSGFKLVGFSVKTNTILMAMQIARWCKDFSGDIVLFVGGPGVTVAGPQFLDEYGIFDYAFVGESERSICDFIDCVRGEKSHESVKGLCYKRGGAVIANQAEVPLELDAIPLPDYSAFDTFELKYGYPLVTSRGCPYDCSYCSVKLVSGKRFRARSPEGVLKELKLAKEKYGAREFQVLDDTFTQKLERTKKICELMISENIGMSWVCPNGIRADRVDRELFRLMKDAGCKGVWLGIESLDRDVFNAIKKGEDIEDILNAVKMAQDAGIDVSAFFIIGLPGSTYAKDMETFKKAKKLRLKLTTWSIATQYPHTALWDWVQKNGRVLRDYREVSFFVEPKCVFETDDYTEKERLKVFYKANLAFSRYDCLTAQKSWTKRILAVLKIIILYDACRLPIHLAVGGWMMAKRAFGQVR
ncbi:MAG: radical SAM protein [Thermodesulfobacteriota bacterium]